MTSNSFTNLSNSKLETIDATMMKTLNELKTNYFKIIYSNFVLPNLIRNTLYSHREWNVIEHTTMGEYGLEYDPECINFIDEDDKELFYDIINSYLYDSDKPYKYNSDCKLINCAYYYTIKQYALFYNIIQKAKKSKQLYDSSVFSTLICKDYLTVVTNRLLMSYTHHNMSQRIYVLYPNEFKWIHIMKINLNRKEGYPDDYRDILKMKEMTTNKYNNEVKCKLYKMVYNEKLNILNKKMLKQLNIDCWKLICDYVC
jgi:hypothetical protein